MTLAAPLDSAHDLDNLRTASVSPLVSPALLRQEHPITSTAAETVRKGRQDTINILNGLDKRPIIVVGPCSIHDVDAAMDYARRLATKAEELQDRLHIVMRVYFEKPRTTLGWKGLINDPDLDDSFAVNKGLRTARKLLIDISEMGLPVGCEFLDPITPQFIADTVTWGSIGARTAASQVHRQLCSALSMPIGIKNSTDGDVQVAIDATRAAGAGHVFAGINADGLAALMRTTGNPDCHVILRGSATGPNYDTHTVRSTLDRLAQAGLPERVVIDASHGNSRKDHHQQAVVVRELAERIASGEDGIVGIMMESFLMGGRQDLVMGSAQSLNYGQSITDACIDWATTSELLDTLASAVIRR